MCVKSGYKTSRTKVDNYLGYDIIKVTEITYERSIFNPSCYTDYPKRKDVHYTFCKEGNDKKPSQYYDAYAKNIAECKECIDKFIEDDTTYFTDEEREKYVYKPNRKCGWAYGYKSLMNIMRQHQKANKRIKILLEDRLTDANFHSACSYLCKCDYEGFEEFVADDCRFREKFEIYTSTKRKRIANPKQFEDGLSKVIEEYLAKQGVKDTSVRVNFIEEW
jgi:hemerythrin